MDKEAQTKTLANELYMLDNGKHSIDYDTWAGRIILNGYRKLPKDKPPLLGSEVIKNVLHLTALGYSRGFLVTKSEIERLLRAQKEADIKHYEGGEQ